MARETLTLHLRARINRPLAYLGAALKIAGDWLLQKAISLEVDRGA